MVFILLTLITEVVIFLLLLRHAAFYWPVFILIIYGVLWYYLDDSEKTGNKSWTSLRNWSLWKDGINAVTYAFGDEEELSNLKKQRIIFVVSGNVTNMGLISGFGLHGGVFDNFDLRYVLPKIFFYVPGLREFLMWTGAVVDDRDVMLSLLNRGNSICYASKGMAKDTIPSRLSSELFRFTKQESIRLIPVEIKGEGKRYRIFSHSVQEYFLKWLGYPFPFCFGPRIFGPNPPPKLTVNIGIPMEPWNYDTCEEFSRRFFSQLHGLV